MAKRFNGNLKFYVYIAVLLTALAGSYAIFGRDVLEMKPEVKLNSEHRIEDEATDKLILEKLDELLRK